ncbi:MAG: hypothetical protein U5K56_07050 [Halioglobus sp.]|nr:hypothetical protein [Halioglobus sp.]
MIIEASIIEVTLTDSLRYGLEWTFDGGVGSGNEGVGQLINDGSIAPNVPGFAYSVINGSGQVKAVLDALASDNLLDVDLLALGDGARTTRRRISRWGIKCRSTPDRQRRMSAHAALFSFATPVCNCPSPVGQCRGHGCDGYRAECHRCRAGGGEGVRAPSSSAASPSRVAVRSSESIVLGGLIRENKSQGSSGVPFLHELPVIGALFGAKTTEGSRTELIVIITPRVIFNDSDLRNVSREMRRQMRGLDLIDISDTSAFLLQQDDTDEPRPAEVRSCRERRCRGFRER